MRKTILLLMALAVVAIMVMPALAGLDQTKGVPRQGPYTIPTSTDVTTQGGVPPIVKAKWETTNPNSTGGGGIYSYMDDDLVHNGTQVNPVLLGFKYVYYFVVVTDSPVSDIANVWVDVRHPDNSVKYQFQLPSYFNELDALHLWENVYSHNPTIITYGVHINTSMNNYTYDEIWDELNQGNARIYYGQAKLSYCQPAGQYKVDAIVYDQGGLSGNLKNNFWYVPTVGVAYDFTVIDYDHFHSVYLGVENQYDGDTNFGTAYNPTVRVTGNVPVFFNVTQDDMGFNWSGSHVWNVHYKARLGGISSSSVSYDPKQTVVIPGHLRLCTTEKFDFWINPVKKWLGANSYSGHMTLWALQWDQPAYVEPDYNASGWTP